MRDGGAGKSLIYLKASHAISLFLLLIELLYRCQVRGRVADRMNLLSQNAIINRLNVPRVDSLLDGGKLVDTRARLRFDVTMSVAPLSYLLP